MQLRGLQLLGSKLNSAFIYLVRGLQILGSKLTSAFIYLLSNAVEEFATTRE